MRLQRQLKKKMTSKNLADPVTDLRGDVRDASPPGVQILSFLCSFRQKRLVSIPTLGVGAPSGKSWIRHWDPWRDPGDAPAPLYNLFNFHAVLEEK